MRDGMDVINFSGGGPQADPRTDVLIEAVSNVVRAGVVPVISAGNDRDFFGLGTAGSPATAPDAISVGAVANAHVFGASLQVVSPSGLPRMPFVADRQHPARRGSRRTSGSSTSATIPGASRQLCDGAPRGSLSGAIALVAPRRLPLRREGVARARRRARRASSSPRTGPATRRSRSSRRSRAGRSPTSTARGSARRRGAGGAVTVRFTTRHHARCRRPGPACRRASRRRGLTPFGHALKPDVTAPGAQILSSTLPEFAGRPKYRGARRDELLGAARRRRRGASHPAPPDLDAAADEVGAHVDRRPGVRGHDADGGGVGARPGRRARAGSAPPTSRCSSPTRSRSRSATSSQAAARTRSRSPSPSPTRATARARGSPRCSPRSRPRARRSRPRR